MKKVFLSLVLAVSVACGSVQTTEYKTLSAAQAGADVALSLYESEFEAHQTTSAQDAAVTKAHRAFEAAIVAVAQANIAYNDANVAIAAGKATTVDPVALRQTLDKATKAAIQAGVDLVNLINSFKK